VAFIMAEYTGIPYADIALAAIVPALLYYLGVMTQVHFLAKRQGLRGLPDDQIPGFVRALKGGEVFVIPLVVLIVALVMGYSATRVAVIGSVAVFLTALFRAESRIGLRGLFECLSETTVRCVAVTAACAAAGMVIGGLNMTGLAAKFSNMILLFSGGELFISLVIAGAITVLLGMGMPTPSAYILAVVLVGPALARLGMDQMTANMFLLYFAVMSASTPPVAVAAFAAAAICQANPIHIAAQATRLSIAAFVVPFTFAYSPVLLLRGEVLDIAWAVVTAVIGIWLVAVAVEGFFRVRIAPWARVVLGAGGLCFIATNPWAPLAGAALAAVALAPQFAGRTGARAT
jgi:TRAP transporter 4TM/12TM fusion protein